MAKDKFSTAPWHVEARDGNLHLIDADDTEICYEEEWDSQYENEQTANFALLAASPRLLHALESLVGEAALELGETYPPVVEARAAIRLAREGA
jgi:hypothetical protein